MTGAGTRPERRPQPGRNAASPACGTPQEGPAPCPTDLPPHLAQPAAGREDDADHLAEQLIVAEAGDVARGWRFLTVDNLAPRGDADALLYERILDTFDEAAGDRECRHRGRRNGVTFGIRGEGAARRIAWLRTRLERLNPPQVPGYGNWDIRDGAR